MSYYQEGPVAGRWLELRGLVLSVPAAVARCRRRLAAPCLGRCMVIQWKGRQISTRRAFHWRGFTVIRPRNFPETRPSLLAGMNGSRAESAWRDFFDRYAPAVFRVARLRGLGPEDADDIVQQVMLAVANHIGRFEYDRDRGHFRQWVRRITDNKIRDWRKGRRPPGVAELSDWADTDLPIEEIWERQWRLQDIDQCLSEIAGEFAPHRVKAFRLYVMEGLSAEETADQTGMTIGHVYVTRTQILKRIRQRMGVLEERH